MTLQVNMILAWQEAGERAADDLRIQQEAPALTRPEYAAQRVDDLRYAMAQMRAWS